MSASNITQHPRWQPEEYDYLIAMYGKLTAAQIAAAMPLRSAQSVQQRALYLGLTGRGQRYRRIDKAKRLQAIAMRRRGVAPQEIASAMSVSLSWVRTVLVSSRKRRDAAQGKRAYYPSFDTAEESIMAAHAIAEMRQSPRCIVSDFGRYRIMPAARARKAKLDILETVIPIKGAA